MARREYNGGAVETTLTADITSTSTTITVADGSTFPTGAVGPFVIDIDAGTASYEKVLVTSRTGNTLTVASTSDRGFDGTSATAHTTNAKVRHVLAAVDLDEVNAHAFDTSRDDHTQYLTQARHDATTHTSAMLGTDSVTATQIAAAAVGTAEIADNAVTTAKIAAAAVGSSQIAANAVGTTSIVDGAVTDAKIATGVDGAKLTANSVTPGSLSEVSFDAVLSATQSVSANTLTYVSWTSEVRDTHGFGDGTSTLTIPTGQDGLYLVTFRPQLTAGGGYTAGAAYIDPSTGSSYSAPLSTVSNVATVTAILWLSAGDTLSCQVYLSGSGSWSLSTSTRVTLERIK